MIAGLLDRQRILMEIVKVVVVNFFVRAMKMVGIRAMF
jgi:hypothetical protein